MNPSAIHPALRPGAGQPYSSPVRDKPSNYAETAHTAYSPLQPSPQSFAAGTTPNYNNFVGSHQSHESPDDDASPAAGGDPNDPNDLKRPRACEACRQLKVKCEPDDSHPTGSCKRCAKANRHCVVTAPSRKRQKKTDSRVAELEKKIDALTASLAARGGHDDPALDPTIGTAQLVDLQRQRTESFHESQWPQNGRQATMSGPSTSGMHQGQAGMKRKLDDNYQYYGQDLPKAGPQAFKSPMPAATFDSAYSDKKRKSPDVEPYVDIIDRGVIDQQTAYRCFDRYIAEMCEQLPIVVFPPGTKATDIRKNKPLLFLAILAVSAGTIRPDLQPKFVSEVTRTFADRIVYRGEKSLELCQTVQLMTSFYSPPERYEELNFNQLIHIAAVMALDIGMGKRSKSSAMAMWKEYMDKRGPSLDANAAETRRCWLGVYFMCANSAMSLRRPLLIRWGPYSEECIEVLANAPDALPSDKWLCHLVRAQHIAEDVGFQFSMDDPASQLSLTEPKTQYHLKAFERQLKDWQDNSTSEIMSKPLVQHTEAIINLYMHEIAMHHNHNIDDFKPPYNITPLDGPSEPDFVTPAHIEALTICLASIHNAFDAFLSMDVKVLRALPTLFFVRNSYAAVALIKMYSAVSAKGSKFGSIFKTSDLKVEQYLDRLINRLTKTAEGGASRVAHKFSFICNMLKNWHLKRVETGGNGKKVRPNMGRVLTTSFKDAPEQDPRTFTWANSHVSSGSNSNSNSTETNNNNNTTQHPVMNQNSNGQNQPRSGLQMLSDAAMVKNSPDPTANMGPMQQNWAGPPLGQMAPPYTGLPGVVDDPTMMGYPMGTDMDPFAFSAEEVAAMGNLDDPGWFSFGLEQGGWAF